MPKLPGVNHLDAVRALEKAGFRTIAWIFHGQKLDVWALVGMGLIVSGVAVLNLLSRLSR